MIEVDGKVIDTLNDITSGVKRYVKIAINNYSLGNHTVKITASDALGEKAIRTYTFSKINSAPEINGSDMDLGEKNSPFSIVYQVRDENNDPINVIAKLNGSDVLQNLSNVDYNKDITLTITDDKLQTLEINKINTIEIEANDGKGGVKYRRYTFKRTNFAPVISGSDRDLGTFEDSISFDYSATDMEKDEIKLTVYLDNEILIPEMVVEDNKNYTHEISGFNFTIISPGRHEIKIIAIDAKGAKTQRILTFTRVVNELITELMEIYETDIAAKRILANPVWQVAAKAGYKVEVCNNAFDEDPAWEDATSVAEIGKVFLCQNETKTAEKWGVNARLSIERKEAVSDSYINGIGGAFE